MSDRWKCPECGAWVSELVLEHHCNPGSAATGTAVPIKPIVPDPNGTSRPYPWRQPTTTWPVPVNPNVTWIATNTSSETAVMKNVA